ncbi:MAG: DNA polymerase III subunit beta [Acidobacteria bacterium]|nr:DNA polymerase III subunit beta [Acidobacteriota bacterium]
MEFTVKKNEILKELGYVQGVVEKKNTIPILSNLLLEAAGSNLTIMATDLDVSIRCSCPAKVKSSGALTVSARKVFDIVRSLPDESEISFKLADKEWMAVSSGPSRFKVVGMHKDNFPVIPEYSGRKWTVPGEVFRNMVSRTIFAITQEESRYSLNGALLVVNADGLRLVTTDGHRLAYIEKRLKVEGLEGEFRVLVPRKTLAELAKLAGDPNRMVQFAKDENHLYFHVDGRYMVSRQLAGQFPNYEMVIPKDNDKKLLLETEGFAEAIRRAAIMADERSHGIKLSLSEGQLVVTSSTSDLGEARESVQISYDGQPMEVGFNAQYLLDFLGVAFDKQVSFQLKDDETQGLLQPATEEDYQYSYVVMPMKL